MVFSMMKTTIRLKTFGFKKSAQVFKKKLLIMLLESKAGRHRSYMIEKVNTVISAPRSMTGM